MSTSYTGDGIIFAHMFLYVFGTKHVMGGKWLHNYVQGDG